MEVAVPVRIPLTSWKNVLEETHCGRVTTRRSTICRQRSLTSSNDQSSRGQILKLTEVEARRQYPNLVVASLDEPGGIISAGVLFTEREYDIRRRAPVASDLRRIMREKDRVGERTFSLAADVAEAHRQVPVDPRLLGCQVETGGDVFINHCRDVRSRLRGTVTGHELQHQWTIVTSRASGPRYRAALISFFVLCSTAGFLLKTAGGDEVTWVGFELRHKTYQLGSFQDDQHFVRRGGPWQSDVCGGNARVRTSLPRHG